MNKADLEERTRNFALRMIGFVNTLPPQRAADVLGRQMLRSGTSVGANYREANRAESRSDFIHKIALAEKEAAETLYWLELCGGAEIGDSAERGALLKECDELVAIFTRIGRTTKANIQAASALKSTRASKSEIRNPKSEVK